MDVILKKGVEFCFPPGILQDVALHILQESENSKTGPVSSLKMQSLKTMMTDKMRKDIYANVIFRLIFREKIALYKFEQRFGCRNIFYKIKRNISDFFTGFPKKHKIYREMTKDPYIMKAVLEQNLPDKALCVKIAIDKEVTRVEILWLHMVEVKNEKEYDTYWADVFTRLVLSKDARSVTLNFVGDENSDLNKLREQINNWVDSIKPRIPEEGWKEAIENGKMIYQRGRTETYDNYVSVTFYTPWTPEYSDKNTYWGYLKQ